MGDHFDPDGGHIIEEKFEDALSRLHSLRAEGPVFASPHSGPLFSFAGGPRDIC